MGALPPFWEHGTPPPKWEQGRDTLSVPLLNRGRVDVVKQLRTARHKALMRVLAEARQAAGMTQRDLAAKLGRAHSFVGKYESGERQLSVLEFVAVADALKVAAPELLRRVID